MVYPNAHDFHRLLTPLRPVLGYLTAIAGVGFVTVFIGLVTTRPLIPNISMLYLLAIFVIAMLFGTGPAVAASLLAFFAYDWFFVEPLYTFTISDPAEWLALLLFLVAAVLIGYLASVQRQRTDDAVRREREAVALYDISKAISVSSNLDEALTAVAEKLNSGLNLHAVSIFVPETDGTLRVRAASGETIALTREEMAAAAWVLEHGELIEPGASRLPMRLFRVLADVQIADTAYRVLLVPLNGTKRTEGVLRLVREPDPLFFPPPENRFLTATANHLGWAIQRYRLQEMANEDEILRRTNELQTALLRAVSHDLRTPLAGIQVAADSLLQRDVKWDQATAHDFAETIYREAERLGRLVSNLLDLSRIKAGAFPLQKEPYPISAVVRQVVGHLDWLLRDHQIIVDVRDDLPLVSMDYVKIGQVLSNLLENAAKYAPHGTEIRVSAWLQDEQLQINVSDQGPGIPAAERTRVFEKFYQIGTTHAAGTSGLGLAICKGQIEAHGGQIWVQDTPGGGATFVFTLPVAEYGESAERAPLSNSQTMAANELSVQEWRADSSGGRRA